MLIALDERYRAAAGSRFAGHEVIYYDRTQDKDTLLDALRDVEILGSGVPFRFTFDREVIERLPRLQLIHKSGSGYDAYDVEAMSEHGILFTTNQGINASSVAQHMALLTLLCLRRHSFSYLTAMRRGEWQKRMPGLPTLLDEKTVGVVGLGEIGSHYARYMIAFGASVIAYQRHQRPEIPILTAIRWSTLDDLLRESDVVALSAPLTRETYHLIGAREIGLMKPTASFVNCSRGQVVDEKALYDALVSGRLATAGLDVFEEEPTAPDNPLLKLENVFATPHIAGFSTEGAARQIEGCIHSIELFLSGRRPPRLVNPEILTDGRARAKGLV